MTETPRRPGFLTFLSILHIIGGGIGLLMTGALALVFLAGGWGEGTASFGVSPVLLLVLVGIITTLGLASGFGLWMGRRWGWSFAVFYYFGSISRSANQTLFVVDNRDLIEESGEDGALLLVKYGMRAVIHSLFLLYLFASGPREYCGVSAKLSRMTVLWSLLFAALWIGAGRL